MVINLWMMVGQTLHRTQTHKLPSPTLGCDVAAGRNASLSDDVSFVTYSDAETWNVTDAHAMDVVASGWVVFYSNSESTGNSDQYPFQVAVE